MIETDHFEGITPAWRRWVNRNDRLVLITGATGYVGSRLVPHLLADGWKVRCFDTQLFGNSIADLESEQCEFIIGDITSAEDCRRAAEGATDVIHLCGVVTDELVDLNKRKGWSVNVGGTQVLLKAAADHLVSRFIYASSSSVYGHAAARGIPDESVMPEPQTEYARQKLAAEQLVLESRDFECVTAVRQATACGPAPRMRLDTVVNVFSKQAYFDGELTPYGGEQFRSNVHVADAVEFYRLLLLFDSHLVDGRPWNVTMGNMRVGRIAEEVAEVAREVTGREMKIEVKDVADPRSYRLSGERAYAELGFRPQKTVKDAAFDNFQHFAETDLDPDDDIYVNNKRMRDVMLQESK